MRFRDCQRIVLASMSVLLFATTAHGHDQPDVHTRLQGTWQLVGGEQGGQAFPEVVTNNVRLIFTEDTMTTRSGANETTFQYTIRADENPLAIDLDMNGSIGKGIFRLEADQLTIVHTEAGEPRPKEFSAGQGTRHTMMVLKKLVPQEFTSRSKVESARAFDLPFRSHDDLEMFGKLFLPEKNSPKAIVIYVQTAEGATVDMTRRISRTETFNYYDLYRDLLTKDGIGFFSYEGRGIRMGDSPPRFEKIDDVPFNTGTLDNKVNDVLSAIATVRSQPDCSDVPVFLMGSSEGTLLAAEAAARRPDQVQALILYGVLATNMRENFRYIMSDGAFLVYRDQFDTDEDGLISQAEFLADPKKYRERVLGNADFSAFDRDADGNFTRDEMCLLTKVYLDAIDNENFAILQAWAKTSAAVRVPDDWFKDHFAHEPIWTFLSRLDIPVGLFHGAKDTNTPIGGVKELEKMAKQANRDRMEFHYFDDLDHSLNISEYFVSGTMPAAHVAIFDFIRKTAEGKSN